jgi:hypothetical protein
MSVDPRHYGLYTPHTSGMKRSLQRGYECLMAHNLRFWNANRTFLLSLNFTFSLHFPRTLGGRVSTGTSSALHIICSECDNHLGYFDWSSSRSGTQCAISRFVDMSIDCITHLPPPSFRAARFAASMFVESVYA